jgi:anti-sigma factor (TIGR02949 family)
MSKPVSCNDALDQLWALIDSELCDADAECVQEHIDRCKSCFPHYDFERAYRRLVALQCRQEAPVELRRRVFMLLLAEDAE